MASEQTMDAKLEAFFDKLDKRLESMENKLDGRLSMLEDKFGQLEIKTKKHERHQVQVVNEVQRLKVSVSLLEQRQLERNIIIQGIPESNNENDDSLSDMAETILCHLDTNFESHCLKQVRRIGNNKNSKKNRHTLVVLDDCSTKLNLMKDLSKKNVNCSMFKHQSGEPWGQNKDKIFISDHLTSTMSSVFYRARQLKKQKLIKYAWSKLGRIYVKQDDEGRAINLKSMEDLKSYELEIKKGSETSDSDGSSSVVDSEPVFVTASKTPAEFKRQRSKSSEEKATSTEPPKRSKRIHNKRHQDKQQPTI